MTIDIYTYKDHEADEEKETQVLQSDSDFNENIVNILKRALNSDDENLIISALDIAGKAKIKELLPEINQLLEKQFDEDLELKNINSKNYWPYR